MDGVFAAYLFRNLSAADDGAGSTRDQVLRAVRDLLRPGGVLVVEEYSVAGSPARQLIWTLVCHLIVMPLSRLARTDVALYQYLWRSVLRFDSVARFAERLRRAGFLTAAVGRPLRHSAATVPESNGRTGKAQAHATAAGARP